MSLGSDVVASDYRQSEGRSMAREVRKSVSDNTRRALWGRGAGVCYMCHRPLTGDLLTGKDELNLGYVAHIVGAVSDGPRGSKQRSSVLADSIDNLMLLCNDHHRVIDHPQHWRDYPEELLLRIKQSHEAKVAVVTQIPPDRKTTVLLFGAGIGDHDGALSAERAKNAVFPDRYPDHREPTILGMDNLVTRDQEDLYWRVQVENLRRQFLRRVKVRIEDGEVSHISVFALAPQPLLIELGRLLGDITPADVFQLQREPAGWRWNDDQPALDIVLDEMPGVGPEIGLIIGLSATVDFSRARAVLPGAPVYRLSIDEPRRDCIGTRDDLARLRAAMRSVLNAISKRHGRGARIHLFPAVPVSAAVEIGRVWMPKADLPITIYDEHRDKGGFHPCHQIGEISVTNEVAL